MSRHAWATLLMFALSIAVCVAIVVHLQAEPLTWRGAR